MDMAAPEAQTIKADSAVALPAKREEEKKVDNSREGDAIEEKGSKQEVKEQQAVQDVKEAGKAEETVKVAREGGGQFGLEDDDVEIDDDTLLPEAQPTYPRSEVGSATPKYRDNAVHVYGLDFLKTDHMNEIFSQFQHKYIEWINESSANIIFRDAAGAKQALESLSYPKTGDDPWRRTPDILVTEDSPPVFLQLRLAVSTDVKQPRKAMPKLLPLAPSAKVGRRRGGAGAGVGAGGESELQRLLKSPRPLTEEERLKRQKRAERFGVSQSTPPQKPATEEPANTASQVEGESNRRPMPEGVEATTEELAKRQKRSERFGAPSAPEPEPAEPPPVVPTEPSGAGSGASA